MAAIPFPARSAYTYFPYTEKAARRAARTWFAGAPTMTLAAWRDERCAAHCAGLPDPDARATAFNAEFSRELASIIANGGRHD